MKLIAVYLILGTSTWVRIEVENHDKSLETIEADCTAWGKVVRLDFMYFEEPK